MTKLKAATNRRRNARHLVGLANQGIIRRGEATGELSKATAALRREMRLTEAYLGREHRV